MNNEDKHSQKPFERNESAPISFKQSRKKQIISILIHSGVVLTFTLIVVFLTISIIFNRKINDLGIEKINSQLNKRDITDEAIPKTIEKARESIVTIAEYSGNIEDGVLKKGNTSGFIVDKKGYIVTSYSSIKNFHKIYVKVSSRVENIKEASLVGYYKELDIAILKIQGDNYITCVFADTDSLKPGDGVLSLGNANADEYIGYVSSGIINTTKKIINASLKQGEEEKYSSIEDSTLVNEENNGGPLCNFKGEVIGMNTVELTKRSARNLTSIVVGGKEVQSIIRSIIDTGNAEKTDVGFIGGATKNEKSDDKDGVYVELVYPHSAAANAGIEPTDIITELDDKDTRTIEDIENIIKNYKVGDAINCKILRRGVTMNLKLQLVKYKMIS